MKSIYDDLQLSTSGDVINLFKRAVAYRSLHRDESEKVARFVFDSTHNDKVGFPLDEKLERIRFEFGALEAPGQPNDDTDAVLYVDRLWLRLSRLIDEANEKWTV